MIKVKKMYYEVCLAGVIFCIRHLIIKVFATPVEQTSAQYSKGIRGKLLRLPYGNGQKRQKSVIVGMTVIVWTVIVGMTNSHCGDDTFVK